LSYRRAFGKTKSQIHEKKHLISNQTQNQNHAPRPPTEYGGFDLRLSSPRLMSLSNVSTGELVLASRLISTLYQNNSVLIPIKGILGKIQLGCRSGCGRKRTFQSSSVCFHPAPSSRRWSNIGRCGNKIESLPTPKRCACGAESAW
jgi:hypothetical protein